VRSGPRSWGSKILKRITERDEGVASPRLRSAGVSTIGEPPNSELTRVPRSKGHLHTSICHTSR
jgi:hypothetical protein